MNNKPSFETNFNGMTLLILILYSVNKDVDTLRKYARTRFDYGIDTSFGVRTQGIITDEQNRLFNSVFKCIKKKICQHNSHFLFIPKHKLTYNHIDCLNDHSYAAVCYLNDKQLRNSGLSLKDDSGLKDELSSLDKHYENMEDIPFNSLARVTHMKTTGFFSEECNKLLLYKANRYHHIYQPYGEDDSNARLGNTFFFHTNTLCK